MSNLLSISEMASVLGVTPKTIRLLEKEGKITFVKTEVGHGIIIDRELNASYSLLSQSKIPEALGKLRSVEGEKPLLQSNKASSETEIKHQFNTEVKNCLSF